MRTPQGQLAIKDIASLAGVTRAAVTNWRTRHSDFPAPVEGSNPRRPRFDYPEIIAWLKKNELLEPHSQDELAASQYTAALYYLMEGSRSSGLERASAATLALSHLAALKHIATPAPKAQRTPAPVISTIAELNQLMADTDIVDKALKLPLQNSLEQISDRVPADIASRFFTAVSSLDWHDYPSAAQHAIDFFFSTGGRGIDSTYGTSNSRSSQLLANAALSSASAGDLIFDPACGVGGSIFVVGMQREDVICLGRDINTEILLLAALMSFLKDVPSRLEVGDSLSPAGTSSVRADVVLTEPPFGMRLDRKQSEALASAAGFNFANSLTSDAAFILETVRNLKEQGTGYVLSTAGTASQNSLATLRQSLVAQGCVEALIQLPPKFLSFSSISTVLWVLKAPQENATGDITIIDATDTPTPEKHIGEWLTNLRQGGEPDVPTLRIGLADIIKNNNVLLPAQYFRDLVDTAELKERLTTAYRDSIAVWEAIRLPSLDLSIFAEDLPQASGTITFKELASQGAIEILRGNARKPKRETPEGSATLLPLRADGEAHAVNATTRSVEAQAGDILVPNFENIPARVFEGDDGTWLVPEMMTLVRVTETGWDPHYLAACINASFNRQPEGTSAIPPRRNTHSCTVPYLPISEQKKLSEGLAQINTLAGLAQELQTSFAALKDAAFSTLHYS